MTHCLACPHSPVFVAGTDLPSVLSDPRDILIKVVMVVIVMLPLCLLRNISRLEKVRSSL